MTDNSIETSETPLAVVPQPRFPLWLAWMLAGALILGGLNPALGQGYQALTKSLNLTQQVANTAQIFLWALVSVALGYATSWLLRKFLPDTQMWMALATAAWLLVGLHTSYPYFYSMVQDPSQYPDQGNYRLVIVILGNLVSMVALSFAGWLVLRQSYRRAAYWILWSVVAAGVAYGLFMLSYTYLNTPGTAIGDFYTSNTGALTRNAIFYLVTFGISGVGLQLVLRNRREEAPVEHLKWKNFLALWVFANLIGVVASDIFSGNGIQAALQTALKYPAWVDAGVSGLINGIILGIAGWLVLAEFFPKAGWWLPAVAIGQALSQIVSNFLYEQVHLSEANIFWYSLLFSLVGVLVLGLFEMAVLYVFKMRRIWLWIPIILGAELVNYLLTYFVNQKLAVLTWTALIGLGLVFMARGGLGKRWTLLPAIGAETDPEDMQDDKMVLTDRLRLALASRPQVRVESDHLDVFPNKNVEPELLEWLLTERGSAQVIALSETPAEGADLPADAPIVLTEEDFYSVDQEPGSDEEHEKLVVGVEEDSVPKLEKFMQDNPDARLYLALDGSLITSQPAVISSATLTWDNLAPEDTFLYTAVLSEPALSTQYKASLTEEGV